ncbi:MAG TPA: hypothetical protein EYP10_13775 [Armatimonadetes bacterium]|nr:hypothetical protein [Armatimonadota bacterium]
MWGGERISPSFASQLQSPTPTAKPGAFSGGAGAGILSSRPTQSPGSTPRRQAQLNASMGRPPSGGAPGAPSQMPSERPTEAKQQSTQKAQTDKFKSLADLLRVPGLSTDKARMILDRVTVWDEPVRYGVVNVNTAPAEVLMCIPGMTEAVLNDIISFRESNGAFESLGQLLELPSMDEATFGHIIDRIAIRSQVFRITAIGWVPSSGARHVIECIIERIPPQPVEEGEVGEGGTTYASVEQSNATGAQANTPTFVVRYWRER